MLGDKSKNNKNHTIFKYDFTSVFRMFGNMNLPKRTKIVNLCSYYWFCFQAILLGQVIFQRISKSEIMSKKPSKHIYFGLTF